MFFNVNLSATEREINKIFKWKVGPQVYITKANIYICYVLLHTQDILLKIASSVHSSWLPTTLDSSYSFLCYRAIISTLASSQKGEKAFPCAWHTKLRARGYTNRMENISKKKRDSRCYWFVLLPNSKYNKKGGRRSDDEIPIMVNAYSACWTVFCFLFGKIHANEIAQWCWRFDTNLIT